MIKKMITKRLHYFSGITIIVFILLHLFNHVCSIDGAQAHISVMNFLRLFYRNEVIEPILLLAVIIQIISGIKLFNAKRKLATSRFDKLQLWSGIYLAVFFIVHLSAIFTGRFFLHLDTNFYFGVAALNTFPLNLFFIPYYALAIIAFFGHIAAVHNKKMKRSILGLTPRSQSISLLIFGCLLTVVIFYGLTNHFSGVNIPSLYNVLIGK